MTAPQTFWVTPRLLVGRVPAGIQRARPVSSPQEAVQAIDGGFTAVLPAGAWEAVRRILTADMGLSQRDAMDRIHFAQHGQTL